MLFSTSSGGVLFRSSHKDVTLAISLDAADVWVGGNQVGTTPIELELNNRASHRVAFEREGYSDMEDQILWFLRQRQLQKGLPKLVLG